MTNEWTEFRAYTEKPRYAVSSKNDKSFLGRFTLEMIADFTGFSRIFTIIARGYLFHDADGSILSGDPYDRIEYARDALCAWCSVPDTSKSPAVKVDYRELHDEFPKLVSKTGRGWFYEHVKNILKFTETHPDEVSKAVCTKCRSISEGFLSEWKKRVRHLNVPIFALNTKAAWGLRFDDVLADALEAGPLRVEDYPLTEEIMKKIDGLDTRPVKKEVAAELVRFYFANKPDDSDWVILPVANFNAYFGSTTFERKWLPALPKDVFIRETRQGVCRFRVNL